MAISTVVAECLAGWFGLLTARDMELKKISLEGDCKVVISLLKGEEQLWPLDTKGILADCKVLNYLIHVTCSRSRDLQTMKPMYWPLRVCLRRHLG